MKPIFNTPWKAKLRNVSPWVSGHWQALRCRLGDQVGQTLAEYALIMSLVAGAVLITSLVLFRDNIASAFDNSSSCIQGTCAEAPESDENDHCNNDNGNDPNTPACET